MAGVGKGLEGPGNVEDDEDGMVLREAVEGLSDGNWVQATDGLGIDVMEEVGMVKSNQFSARLSLSRSFMTVLICAWRASTTSSQGRPSDMPMTAWST